MLYWLDDWGDSVICVWSGLFGLGGDKRDEPG